MTLKPEPHPRSTIPTSSFQYPAVHQVYNIRTESYLMRDSRFGMVLAALAVLMLPALPPALGTGVPRTHLDWANLMVREVRPENTSYQHKQGHVSWKGIDGATQYESHTDCSGFLNALFERAYGFDKQYYQRWLGKGRPYAITYHDAIASQHGFTRVDRVGDVRPGDIIAI